MIEITREEKDALVKRYPNLQFVRTMRQESKRGHYYCEENKKVVAFLERYRKTNVIEEHFA